MNKRSLHIIRDEHASLAAMLHAMLQLVERGPLDDAQNFFEAMRSIDRLERDHMQSENAARDLLHLLLAWELLGHTRRADFVSALGPYVESYLEHMHLEETVVLPAAERALSDEDWTALDNAFEQNTDPLTGKHVPGPVYEKLFSQIVSIAPAPIGLG